MEKPQEIVFDGGGEGIGNRIFRFADEAAAGDAKPVCQTVQGRYFYIRLAPLNFTYSIFIAVDTGTQFFLANSRYNTIFTDSQSDMV